MTLTNITYDRLQITPFELVSIQELRMTKRLNEHTRLSFTAILPEELQDSYVQLIEADSPVCVSQLDEVGTPTPLFKGTILHMEVKAVRDVYYLEVEAISHTYKLDIRKKDRSFQDKNMKVEELLRAVGRDYPGFDIIDSATGGAALGRIAVQYRETDWEFLKRIASRYHTSLTPASVFEVPKCYFGVEETQSGLDLTNYHYTVSKRVADYRYFNGNDTAHVNEHDFIDYLVEAEQVLELGSTVTFKGKSLYVYKVDTHMQKGVLQHVYTLTSHKGLRHKEVFNEQLIGLSLPGKVIQVERDRIKLHLNIDAVQDPTKAHWFTYVSPYTAEGHSGWYVMPELGDTVLLYFPAHREEEGMASTSLRQKNQSIEQHALANPDIKLFRTAHGKEIKLTPDEIVITSKEGAVYIQLNEKDGIHIVSDKQIHFSAGGNISIHSGSKVKITAGDEIQMTSKGSTVSLGGMTNVLGSEVKTN